MSNIKICTYNIRFDNEQDNNLGWGWKDRAKHIVNLVDREKFDILAVQEALPHQVDSFKQLDIYEFYGVSRSGNTNDDEYNGIFYKKERFEKLDGGYFWLSKTPEKPSLYFGTICRRICVWVMLQDKKTDEKYVFTVTHLDHMSSEARVYGANLILERLSEYYRAYPFVLMGDFNSTPEDEVYKNISKNLKEVKYICNFNPKGTFTDNADFSVNSTEDEKEIDFIFINDRFSVEKVEILRDSYKEKYISDHFPVVANLKINKNSI